MSLAATVNGANPVTVAETFGDGLWDLAKFTLQAAMVVLTGYVVATSPPVARIIERIAKFPSTPRGSVAFVALLSCLVSMLNWGLSLVFSGLLARAIARRSDLRSDYRALGAAAYLGLGAVAPRGTFRRGHHVRVTVHRFPRPSSGCQTSESDSESCTNCRRSRPGCPSRPRSIDHRFSDCGTAGSPLMSTVRYPLCSSSGARRRTAGKGGSCDRC